MEARISRRWRRAVRLDVYGSHSGWPWVRQVFGADTTDAAVRVQTLGQLVQVMRLRELARPEGPGERSCGDAQAASKQPTGHLEHLPYKQEDTGSSQYRP
jgi:hypothetical protein